jgi:CubicO group peptidase (beta-lactamase class C family)
MSKESKMRIQINGTVEPGFDSVKKLYEHKMQTLAERNTQLCVYHKGKKVVDLWATAVNDIKFSPDSLVNIFSSGKSLEAIAMASLAGKGLLNYDAKIAVYWPEFGSNGKGDLSVADLMRHEGGLASFDVSIDTQDLLTSSIKQNKIGTIIEGQRQKYRKGTDKKREYHAVTRGWIVNEVFRRIDPESRTIGEYVQGLNHSLGVDVFVGVKDDQLSQISHVFPLKTGFIFLESLKPEFLKRKIESNLFQILGKLIRFISLLRSSTTTGSPPPFKGMKKIEFFNEAAVARGETPSANTHSTARALAKIAAMMAAGGQFADEEFITKPAWDSMHKDPMTADMGFLTTTFTQGGVAFFPKMNAHSTKLDKAVNLGREGFYGWMGLGGSLFQWHPENEIGFAYVPTSLNVLDLVNERGKAYQAEVLKCVEDLGEK